MGMFNKMVETPLEGCKTPSAGNKGGSGTYDGLEGLPKRTPSSNAVPEKVMDGEKPSVQDGE